MKWFQEAYWQGWERATEDWAEDTIAEVLPEETPQEKAYTKGYCDRIKLLSVADESVAFRNDQP